MADVADLKSVGSDTMPVRVRPAAPRDIVRFAYLAGKPVYRRVKRTLSAARGASAFRSESKGKTDKTFDLLDGKTDLSAPK